MQHQPDPEVIVALANLIDGISASGQDLRWWPGSQIATVAYRRWHSFGRRNKSKAPTRDQRIRDLIDGLQSHFESDVPYTHYHDWRSIAEPMADVLEHG